MRFLTVIEKRSGLARCAVVLSMVITMLSAPKTARAQYEVEIGKRTIILDDSLFLDCVRRDTFTLSAERDTLLRRLLRNAYFVNPFLENKWTYRTYLNRYKNAASAQFRREFGRYLARTYGYQKPVDLARVAQDMTKHDPLANDEDRAAWATRILNDYKVYLCRQIPNLPPEELRAELIAYANDQWMTPHGSRLRFTKSAAFFKFFMLNILLHSNICFHRLERCNFMKTKQILARVFADRIFWYLTYE